MAKLGGSIKRKTFGGSRNHLIITGEVTKIETDNDGNPTLLVKDVNGDSFAIRQIEGGKLADLGLRVQIGKDNVDDKVRGIGVGSKFYSDSAFKSEDEVDGVPLINIKGINPLSEKESIMNQGKSGVQIAFYPFNGKHTDFKRGRNGYEPIDVVGNTAKVSTIMSGEGTVLDNPTAGALKEAIVAAADNVQKMVGGRSATIHVMGQDGSSFDFNTPIYKDPKKAYKARKDGQKLSKDDYLDNEGRLEALGKLVDEMFSVPADEVIEDKIAIIPRTTETLTFKSAESHGFLINVAFKDDLAATPEELSENLKNKGWPYRPGLVIMGETSSGGVALNKFIPDTYSKRQALPDALAAAVRSLLPEFDMVAYQENVEALREEAERNRQSKNDNDSPTHAAEPEAGADNEEAPVFDDEDVPSFDD